MAILSERQLWNIYARCYDGLLDFIPYQRLLNESVDALDVSPNSLVADLGCGTGNVTAAVLEREPTSTVHAVDLSESMIRRAHKKFARDSRVQLDQEDLLIWMAKQPDAHFDFVISINVIYVFNHHQREQFFAELRRIMKPTARAVIVTSDQEGFRSVLQEHLRERSFWRSLRLHLVAILLMNVLIWVKESNRQFDPVSQSHLEQELDAAHLSPSHVERCYGGPEEGVNLRFVLEPVIDLRDADDHDSPALREPVNAQGRRTSGEDNDQRQRDINVTERR